MMRLVVLCSVLFAFSVTYGENIEFADAAEGLICRSFALAKKNGMVDRCKDLWMSAHVFPHTVESFDCKRCRKLIRGQNFGVLASYVQKSEYLTIEHNEIRELTKELNNDPLMCSLLDQCSSDLFVLPSLNFTLKSTCDDCKKIVDDVRAFIEDNDTKASIATYLKKAICYELPLQVVDICKRTIDSYIGVLMDLAASELNSGPTCALFGLCPGVNLATKAPKTNSESEAYSWIKRPAPVGFEFFHSRLSPPKSASDATACNECKNVFSRIRDQTKDPAFDQALKNVIKEKLCESFGYFKGMCEAAVSSEVDSMVENASKMNITDLCYFFHQCSDSGVSESAKALKASLYKRFLQPTQVNNNTNTTIPVICPLCEAIIKKLIDLTLTNRSEAAIIAALDEVCYLFPSRTREQCLEFVEKYAPFIIEQIMAGTAPAVICMSLGVCDDMLFPDVRIVDVGDTGCQLCESIVEVIYHHLKTNATKEEIIRELEAACSYLPYVSQQCHDLVENYASEIIDKLLEGVPPKEVCQKFGFCPEVKAPVDDLKDSCTICEVIFSELYVKLRENVTVERIEAALKTICEYIPASYSDKCRVLIEQKTPAIIDLVMQNYSPRKICQELSICYYGNIGGKCDACQQILDFIYTQLEDDATADKIEKVLESVCDYLPSDNLKATCHSYVKAYAQVLIDMLVRDLPPKEICQALGLCPKDSLKKRICSGGPTTWCRDVQMARYCSQTEFCEKYVWKNSSPSQPPAVRLFNCNELVTPEEKCSDERKMRFCGFTAFCTNFKRPRADPTNACRFCRNLLTQRLTYGSFSLDCSIYVNPIEKARCESIRKLRVSGRLSFNNIDSVCKENNLCDEALEPPLVHPVGIIKAPLGDDPCLWGPSVSCRDAEMAARCGVTTYCQQHIWRGTYPPSRASDKVPSLPLIDCTRPLSELCISPNLRYCGASVLKQCRVYAASEGMGEDMRREMCKDRPLSYCSDPRMVELCRMGEYCEAMSMNPTPAPQTDEDVATEATTTTNTTPDPRCLLGPSFVCQNHANAKLCGQEEMCRVYWLGGSI